MDIQDEAWDAVEFDQIERAVLNDTAAGQTIAARFVSVFGDYVSDEVRPVLREVSANGGEPQLLVNGLAELLRRVADAVEFPIGAER